MKTDESHIELLRQAVAEVFGYVPVTPTDFDLLSSDIERRTSRTLSVSTLKRLWGYVTSATSPSYSTLSVLARYVGWGDWDSFLRRRKEVDALPTRESGFYDNGVIVIDSLAPGARLRLEWESSKMIELEKTAVPFQFRVTTARNVKLLKEDLLEIRGLALARPFFAENCRRRDADLGAYSGALRSGIAKIERID